MLDAIAATQLAMDFDQLKLQAISQNIANMNTPGFKRQRLELMSFNEQMEPNLSGVTNQLQSQSIQNQATLTQTRKPTDLALSSEGYFQVQNDQGIFYTRRGDFQINAHGELVTPTGETLLGKGGVIKVSDEHFTINAQGALLVEQHQVDQLNLVRFENPATLRYLGHGLYDAEVAPIPCEANTKVLQGFIEQSNVKSMDEMMELIKTSRHFEANQRVLRTTDSLVANAINQLGESNV